MNKRTIPQSVFDSKEAKLVIKLAMKAAEEILEKNQPEEGDPNHPMYENDLFGYPESVFLDKQYK